MTHRVRLRALAPALAASLLVMVSVAEATALSGAYPNQSRGNRGADVKTIQGLLKAHGATLTVDGILGDAEVEAIKAFQAANGLAVDGRVGSETWTALRIPLEPGDSGEAVKALQRQLNEKRLAKLTVDGVYGDATRVAVAAFQKHAGLTVTDNASATTWRALVAHLELPVWRSRLCDYSVGNGAANWGTGAAIGQLQAAAEKVVAKGHGKVALGDIGFQHGGDIPGHESHEQGLDVDVRLMRDAKDQCRRGGNYHWSSYDRAATRDLVKAIRATATGHVKLIYFNDPVLVDEGLVRAFPGHDDHLHIRYCETIHPVAAYDC